MERTYGFFHTGWGCLAGLVGFVAFVILVGVIFVYFPEWACVKILAGAFVGVILFWLAQAIDRWVIVRRGR